MILAGLIRNDNKNNLTTQFHVKTHSGVLFYLVVKSDYLIFISISMQGDDLTWASASLKFRFDYLCVSSYQSFWDDIGWKHSAGAQSAWVNRNSSRHMKPHI